MVRLAAQGRTNREIAERLALSVRTVLPRVPQARGVLARRAGRRRPHRLRGADQVPVKGAVLWSRGRARDLAFAPPRTGLSLHGCSASS
ncbi:hypothetical protein ACIBQ1_40115 [Nonomuraea sp. NPDC050153]|uniref:hypothetical protein n=1 Tax=Nonomuraea sp. NPDC050153 TaxID=3364359 RepID=UPI0037BD27A8